MKRKVIFSINILLISLLAVFTAEAQKKKKATVKPKPIAIGSLDNPFTEKIPEITDFAFVANIDKNSDVIITIQKKEKTDVFTNTSDAKALVDFFSGFSGSKASFAPILIIKADPSVNYSEMLKVINAFRTSPQRKAKVEISKDFYAFVPSKPDKYFQAKPNPLILVTSMDQDLKLNLNGVSQDDIDGLKRSLKQIFSDRAKNGVYRPGTNLVETTVYIKPAPTVKISEVIAIAEALKEAGSTLIGLAIEDFDYVLEIGKIGQ